MSEAQRLKMTGGHFIWIWADTSSTAEFFQPNSVPSLDDKDQVMNSKNNYEQFNERKQKYEKSGYLQPHSNKRLHQNATRYKSPNTNSNRFHHIVGLRNSGDDGISSALPERGFLKGDKTLDTLEGQVPIKDKRGSKAPDSDHENLSFNLNIKNINSNEFHANYFDPHASSRQGEDDNIENVFGGDFDDSTDAEIEHDYEKINPYKPSSATFATTTRRSDVDTKNTEKSKANNHKNSDDSNRNNRNNGNNNKAPTLPDPITTDVLYSKLFDADDSDLDLESYSQASNDLKAKRADNFPSNFNISSHVFFHHFKDFPVGLLALRHIKMNVDRVFVRSAIRLFASTWSRVEHEEELRMTTGETKNNWQDNWDGSDYDYDDVSGKSNKRQRNKPHVNVNNRHNNARGLRKYKRDAQEDAATSSISNSVNSSNKTSNSNTKLINNQTNKTYSQHVSDLNSHPSDDSNRSNNNTITNNDNITDNINVTKPAEGGSPLSGSHSEAILELTVDGKIEVIKRQNSWWSGGNRGNARPQEKATVNRRTPQYKGGCFGVPTRVDMKRSEVFAR